MKNPLSEKSALSRKLSLAAMNINQVAPALVDAIRPAGVFRQAFRAYPQFNNVSIQNATFGVTDYHAGVFKLEKRFSGGLNFLATYTWSKNLSNIDEWCAIRTCRRPGRISAPDPRVHMLDLHAR